MDRRKFLTCAPASVAAAFVPALGVSPIVVGVDLSPVPSETIARLLAVQNGLVREIHRVTGIPRYQMGRDTWQDQVDAGLSELVKSETT